MNTKPFSARAASAALACMIVFTAQTSRAADHFLTIGGGHSPENDQVSLEQNILFFRDALATLKLNHSPQDVLFADGNANQRDVRFIPAAGELPKVQQFLQVIFPKEEANPAQYRPHQIPDVWGPAQHAALERWFDTVGKSFAAGDRLIIYYTGHGGPGKPPHNTTLALWNEPSLSVRSFVDLLDRLPPKVSVVLIMVQCFSGGFADVLYDKADPSRGLSPQNRCGFFATTFDRTAAGCTPDILLENYREYSTYFWAALCGHTRTGKPVEKPDFLGNGNIEMSEAHAYTMIHSETVDIPTKTSDAFLRQYSRLPGDGAPDLASPDMPYDQLCALAGPNDRAVLDGLSTALRLDGPHRVTAARWMAQSLTKSHDDLEHRRQSADRAADLSRDAAREILLIHWPMLANPTAPLARQTIATRGDQIVATLESSLSYERLRKRVDESKKMSDDADNAERQWVKCQRFINTAEAVALAANLPTVSTKEIQERYHRLIAAEDAPITPAEHQ